MRVPPASAAIPRPSATRVRIGSFPVPAPTATELRDRWNLGCASPSDWIGFGGQYVRHYLYSLNFILSNRGPTKYSQSKSGRTSSRLIGNANGMLAKSFDGKIAERDEKHHHNQLRDFKRSFRLCRRQRPERRHFLKQL